MYFHEKNYPFFLQVMYCMKTVMIVKRAVANMKFLLLMVIFQVPIIQITIQPKRIVFGYFPLPLAIELNWLVPHTVWKIDYFSCNSYFTSNQFWWIWAIFRAEIFRAYKPFLRLISRTIWVSEKSLKFYTVFHENYSTLMALCNSKWCLITIWF